MIATSTAFAKRQTPRRPFRRGAAMEPRAAPCRCKFLRHFPGGFRDETYLDWDRGYKAAAHARWEEQLGRDVFRSLPRSGRYAEAASRAVRIESRTTCCSPLRRWPSATR